MLQRDELKLAVAPFDARVEWTSRGGLLVLIAGTEGAKEQAVAAARCALVIRERLPQAPLALVTGRGEVGAARVVGEVIDRAAELLAAGPAGAGAAVLPVAIDEATAALLDEHFLLAPGEGGRVLVGEATSGVLAAPRTLLGKPAPFVGRGRELATLRSLYDEVAGERVARVAAVVAPAGVGKSRLLQELLRELSRGEGPPQIWIARADPLASGGSLSLVAQALRHAAAIFGSDPPERARQKLSLRARRRLGSADAERVAELLGEVIGAPFPDEDRPALRAARRDRRELSERVQRAWFDFVRAEAAAGPIVLALEDVHWSDPASLRFVDGALGELAEHPLFVVASARPEFGVVHPELWANRGLQAMYLSGLTRRASETLVAA
ncbi:MAG TPA: AAA family ATPase, partial [Polyangiaceae bacterium]|nr:AAA family ATPase [Polyangiaceae bacterium]